MEEYNTGLVLALRKMDSPQSEPHRRDAWAPRARFTRSGGSWLRKFPKMSCSTMCTCRSRRPSMAHASISKMTPKHTICRPRSRPSSGAKCGPRPACTKSYFTSPPAFALQSPVHSFSFAQDGPFTAAVCAACGAARELFLPDPWRVVALALQGIFYGLALADPFIPERSPIKRCRPTVRAFVVLTAAAACALAVFVLPARQLWKETREASQTGR